MADLPGLEEGTPLRLEQALVPQLLRAPSFELGFDVTVEPDAPQPIHEEPPPQIDSIERL